MKESAVGRVTEVVWFGLGGCWPVWSISPTKLLIYAYLAAKRQPIHRWASAQRKLHCGAGTGGTTQTATRILVCASPVLVGYVDWLAETSRIDEQYWGTRADEEIWFHYYDTNEIQDSRNAITAHEHSS